MKSTSLQSNIQEPFLKVIKNNTPKGKKSVSAKIYINTLMPGFSFINHLGKTITPRKCALL